MHFVHKDKNHQYLVFSSREVALLIAFSSSDEKIPTLNGASVVLEGQALTAYATDGKQKSVRGSAKLNETWERYWWMIPRSSLIMASNVLEEGQEAYFPLHGARCALNGFERWKVETSGEDVKLDWHEFDQPIPANTQMGLPFEAIDEDVAGSTAPEVAVDVRYSVASLKSLSKLGNAGLTQNLSLDIQSSGLLHAVTDGGTQWHAVIKPVSLEANGAEEDPEDEDETIDENGDLALQPTEGKRTRRPKKSVAYAGEKKGRGRRGRK
jgi:hypothetical protein